MAMGLNCSKGDVDQISGKKTTLIVQIAGQWENLPREVVQSLSQEEAEQASFLNNLGSKNPGSVKQVEPDYSLNPFQLYNSKFASCVHISAL